MSNILKYKDFIGSVEFSADDDCFFGKIVGIDDLVTFEGSTTKELRIAFYEAVDDYIKTCEAIGKSPTRIYKGSFNVRIRPELHRNAAKYAALHKQSLNTFISEAIETRLHENR